MPDLVARFALFNLGGSILAGLWGLAVVIGLTTLLSVSSAAVRTRLLALPLVKSILVLLGLASVMPFPGAFWRQARATAVPPEVAGPALLVWLGIGFVVFELLRRRAEARLLGAGEPADPHSRVARTTARLLPRFEPRWAELCPEACRGVGEGTPAPRVHLTRAGISPALIGGERPALVLPEALERELDDAELESVVAHELAHLTARGGRCLCSARWTRQLAWASPVAWLVAWFLAHQEELACDEIAAGLTGRPAALASALLKTHRFRRGAAGKLPALANALLGRRPSLTTRLERLTSGVPRQTTPRWRVALVTCLAFVLVFLG